jgi:hypothetical protein
LQDELRTAQIECKTLSYDTAIEALKLDGSQVYEELSGTMLGDMQTPSLVARDGASIVQSDRGFVQRVKSSGDRQKFAP